MRKLIVLLAAVLGLTVAFAPGATAKPVRTAAVVCTTYAAPTSATTWPGAGHLAGIPANANVCSTLTVTASGFYPNSMVFVALYDAPGTSYAVLGGGTVDGAGNISLQTQPIPDNAAFLTGASHVVVQGISGGLHPTFRTLEADVTIH